MSGYSSIFSSGLLATPRPNVDLTDYFTPDRPDSPPIHMDSSDTDTTPTKLNTLPIPFSEEEEMDYFLPRSRASSNASATTSTPAAVAPAPAAPPRLRRRRSSLSVANNALGAVKSPQRSAGIALQRSSLMGPGGRSRSGSIEFGPIGVPRSDEGTRSALRSRRALRKPPPVPPPNAPLPPLPTSVTGTDLVHRRPLVHRAHTAENFNAASSAYLTMAPFDFMKVAATIGMTPPSSSPLAELSAFWGSGPRRYEN